MNNKLRQLQSTKNSLQQSYVRPYSRSVQARTPQSQQPHSRAVIPSSPQNNSMVEMQRAQYPQRQRALTPQQYHQHSNSNYHQRYNQYNHNNYYNHYHKPLPIQTQTHMLNTRYYNPYHDKKEYSAVSKPQSMIFFSFLVSLVIHIIYQPYLRIQSVMISGLELI